MKRLVVVGVVVISLLAAGTAMANFLPVHVARQHSLDTVRRACNLDRHCRYSGLLRCVRVSGHRVDCRTFTEDKSRRRGKWTCASWQDWTLRRYGGLRVHFDGTHCVGGWVY